MSEDDIMGTAGESDGDAQVRMPPRPASPEPPPSLRAVAAAIGATSAGPAPTRPAEGVRPALEEMLPEIERIDAGRAPTETARPAAAPERAIPPTDAGQAPAIPDRPAPGQG